jgi:hypothetical protein
MVWRNLLYNVVHLVDVLYTNYKKYKSYNDLIDLEIKQPPEYNPKIVFTPPQNPQVTLYPKECVSYSVFLQKNPGASKKQRVKSIQRFYDSLY